MKKVLIPTDFSDNASDALGYAMKLLADSDVAIHIVHIIPVQTVPGDVPIDTSDLLTRDLKEAEHSLQILEGFSREFQQSDTSYRLSVTTEVAVGGVAYQIKKIAKETAVDFVIMGTQGTNHSFLDKTLGSISTMVISDAPCPVLLVPRGYEFKPIDTLVFATNLNHSDPYELWRATELIQPHVGVIKCLHVLKDPKATSEKEMEEFASYMEAHSPSLQTAFHIEESSNIEKSLTEFADNCDAELIIMHRSKKSFWERLFTGRHTEKMASWLTIPLLIMNNKD